MGQRFGADLTIFLDTSRAGGTDEVADTVSYAALYKLVRAEVEGEPSKLLENLATRIVRKVLESDARIERARLRVTKLNPPLRDSANGQASITIERKQIVAVAARRHAINGVARDETVPWHEICMKSHALRIARPTPMMLQHTNLGRATKWSITQKKS